MAVCWNQSSRIGIRGHAKARAKVATKVAPRTVQCLKDQGRPREKANRPAHKNRPLIGWTIHTTMATGATRATQRRLLPRESRGKAARVTSARAAAKVDG